MKKLIADVTEVFKAKNPDMVNRAPNFKNMFRNAPNIICICTSAKGGGELEAGLLGEKAQGVLPDVRGGRDSLDNSVP